MPDSLPQRLGSFHLEDMAIIALTAAIDPDARSLHPDLDDQRRARLRSRLKQIGRHDWPASVREDPLLRRGYTLRQCCRLIAALLLIDAHLPPSEAIAFAMANELNILRAIAQRLTSQKQERSVIAADDVLVVVPLGDLAAMVAEKQWREETGQAVQLIRRGDLSSLWSSETISGRLGQRLLLDPGMAVLAVWHWLLERKLMTESALEALLAEVTAAHKLPGFSGMTAPKIRR